MGNGPQRPGNPNPLNPLGYMGTSANMVIMDRRPTPTDGLSWPLGYWWSIPISDDFPDGETWTLSSKENNISTWRRVGEHMPPEQHSGLIHLQTVSTSNTSVPFLALSGDYFEDYNEFIISLNNIAPASGLDSQLNMYVSGDGGSTFVTGTDCGLTTFRFTTGTIGNLTGTVGGGCPVVSNLATSLTGGGSGQFYMSFGGNVPPQNRVPHFVGNSFGSDSASGASATFGGLFLSGTTQVNYIKFIWESASQGILDGRISIYALYKG